MTCLIKHYNAIRATEQKQSIPVNIVWSDNYPGQYRCQQNFLNVAKAAENHDNETIIVHKLAKKY